MATFECDGLEEIDIDPNEYLLECSSRETSELIRLLEDEDDFQDIIETRVNDELFDAKIDDSKSRSYSYLEFRSNLEHLKKAWYSLTQTEIDIINLIAKKYESV